MPSADFFVALDFASSVEYRTDLNQAISMGGYAVSEGGEGGVDVYQKHGKACQVPLRP